MYTLRQLKITDKEYLESWFKKNPDYTGWDYNFNTLWEWNFSDGTHIAEDESALFLSYNGKGKRVFYCPIIKGGTAAAAIKRLFTQFSDSIIKFCPDFILKQLSPEEFDITLDRGLADYIYLAEELITLPGKKFHSKRNHLSRFYRKHPEYTFRHVTPRDFDKLKELYAAWAEEHGGISSVEHEYKAFCRAVENFEALNYKGGIIEIGGKVAAFSICSVSVSNVGQVHFEKADRAAEGAYAAINNFCAKEFFASCDFVNRQEDMGLEGLRKSKLSYNPVKFAEKGYVRPLIGVNHE